MLLRAKPFPVPFLIPSSFYSHLPTYEDGTESVPKRRHINSRRRGITQRKHTTYRTRRKLEIKNLIFCSNVSDDGVRLVFEFLERFQIIIFFIVPCGATTQHGP